MHLAVPHAEYYSIIDLNKGYNQTIMDPALHKATAFVTHLGKRQYIWAPFGLKNMVGFFQQAMDKMLSKVLWRFVLAYLDDVVILSNVACHRLALRLNPCGAARRSSFRAHLAWEDTRSTFAARAMNASLQ